MKLKNNIHRQNKFIWIIWNNILDLIPKPHFLFVDLKRKWPYTEWQQNTISFDTFVYPFLRIILTFIGRSSLFPVKHLLTKPWMFWKSKQIINQTFHFLEIILLSRPYLAMI